MAQVGDEKSVITDFLVVMFATDNILFVRRKKKTAL